MRTAIRQRAIARTAAAVLAAVLGASGLSGCTASTPDQPGATPTPSGSIGMSIERSVTPEETCAQLIDINTLLYNAQAALTTGRVAQQEFDGIARLAGRLAHRVEAAPGTDLDSAISALRSAAGPYTTRDAMTPVDPSSDEWTSAMDGARDECTRAGVEFYIEGWTGG